MQISNHPHATLLFKLYGDLAEGNVEGVLRACADSVTFQVPGKSPLAGKYTKANFAEYLSRLKERSGGTYKFEIHDIMASDLHATVLLTEKVQAKTGLIELRSVHVWRFGQGLPIAGYEYPRDLYAYDQAWS